MESKMFVSMFFALVLNGLVESHKLVSIDGLIVIAIIGLALYGQKRNHGAGG